ncbi:flagellar biosynthesis protein FlhF [Collimonas sp. OK242]|uniref:flagellar biosynthesis protein FlhF n=1 Tax=Collimonas sp. OK242 TaxID=1798195 RepID=UPI000896AC78|nr:flagellar biosynthesis protein FlhF [Collimonas sp. OK242]SDX47685.1 flagellar biosynthesis protein FlhF [Collimonas sp. OK242]
MNNNAANIENRVTIVAPSSREALRLVRERLGADAIIVSNRVTAAGAEIVAMLETAVDLQTPLTPPAAVVPAAAATALSVSVPAPAQPAPSTVASISNDSVISEIHSMRGMIEEQLAGLVWNDKQRRDPVRGHLLRTLLGAGFSASLAKAMLDHLPTGQNFATGMAWVKAELARNLPLMENEDAMMDNGGVYALMGPTGVGKTTTTAKLAARCVMRFGADKLALLTTDSYRIGAFEQLRIYGKILGVSVHAVKDAADLRLVLDDLRDKHMVLIDTVGKSQRDRSVSDQVAMLCGAGRPVKRLLLLNAASHGDTLNEVVHAYKDGAGGNQLAGCIFTKTDEATHPGALLDTVIRHRLPVHYVSCGQKVPENLMIAERSELVDSVFQSASRSALFVPGEADLGELPAALSNDTELAAAAATTERLRSQCQQLIRVLAHDAEELAANAAALADGQIGFEASSALWRDLANDSVGSQEASRKLLVQANTEINTACAAHVLAISGKTELLASRSGDAYTLQSSLLLSDRDGMPLAAPHQLLSTALAADAAGALPTPAQRQLTWLSRQDFGKPLVHLLDRMPAPGMIQSWQADGLLWLARARGTTSVTANGGRTTLAKLAAQLVFSAPEAIVYKGKPAQQTLAEVAVNLRGDTLHGACLCNLRCVATRIVDRHSGKLLASWYLLSNVAPSATASQLAAWYCWKQAADPYYKLLKQAIQQLDACTEPGDGHMQKRLLVAAQVGTTIWRLAHRPDGWAVAARALLAQLAGHRIRSSAVTVASAAALFEGFGKLIAVLDALALDVDNVLDAEPGLAAASSTAALQG